MSNERERARICIKMVVVRNNKKIEKNEYFIEISCKIDKLMQVIYISDSVKQKKQVFSCKIDKKFRKTDVDALTWEFDNDVYFKIQTNHSTLVILILFFKKLKQSTTVHPH